MLNAAKDGYSILVNTLGGMVLAPVTLKDIKYDTNKDFYPVAFITSAPDGLTVRAESPYKNLNDLIDAAKKIRINYPMEQRAPASAATSIR